MVAPPMASRECWRRMPGRYDAGGAIGVPDLGSASRTLARVLQNPQRASTPRRLEGVFEDIDLDTDAVI